MASWRPNTELLKFSLSFQLGLYGDELFYISFFFPFSSSILVHSGSPPLRTQCLSQDEMTSEPAPDTPGGFSTLPEVIPESTPEAVTPSHRTTVSDQPERVPPPASAPVASPAPARAWDWRALWRRHKLLIVLLPVTLAIMAAIVGTVVGLMTMK